VRGCGINVWRARLPYSNASDGVPTEYLYLASNPGVSPATFGFGGTVVEAQQHAREGCLTAEQALDGVCQQLRAADAAWRLGAEESALLRGRLSDARVP